MANELSTTSLQLSNRRVAIPAPQAMWAVQYINTGLFLVDDQGNATAIGGGGGGITALTGDVTASGSGSVVTTIAAGAVTLAKMASIANLTILGNNSGGSAAPQALSAASVKTLLGLSAIATSGLASDLGGSLAVSQIAAIAANKVIGNATGASAVPTATSVQLTMMATQSGNTLLGNPSGGSAIPQEITLGTNLSFSGGTLNATGGGTTYTFSTGLTNATSTITSDLSTGIAGGQTAIGGTAAGNNFTFSSTSNATKGKFIFGSTTGFVYDEANTVITVGIASAATNAVLHAKKSVNGQALIFFDNPNTGTSAFTSLVLGDADTVAGAARLALNLFGTSYSVAGNSQSSAEIKLNGSTTEFQIGIGGATGSLIFMTNATNRQEITNVGHEKFYNTPFVGFTSSGAARAQANAEVMAFGATPPSIAKTVDGSAYVWDSVTTTYTGAAGAISIAPAFIHIKTQTFTSANALTANVAVMQIDSPSYGGSFASGNFGVGLWISDSAANGRAHIQVDGIVYTPVIYGARGGGITDLNICVGSAGNMNFQRDVALDSSGGTTVMTINTTGVGWFGTAGTAKQASGANVTNNVTAGGTTDTIADFTSLAVYATDATTIRNDIYQLARKLKQINDGLRNYGLFT